MTNLDHFAASRNLLRAADEGRREAGRRSAEASDRRGGDASPDYGDVPF